jgi:ABC-type transporter Mla MlaB component
MTHDAATGARLVLEGALTVRTVDIVQATLRQAIEAPPAFADGDNPISIDCAASEEIDLTFILLLIASRISAHRRNKAVHLATPPDGTLLDTLTRGGFQVVRENSTARHGRRMIMFRGTSTGRSQRGLS